MSLSDWLLFVLIYAVVLVDQFTRKENEMIGWAMFWLFCIIYFLVDTLLFLKGFNTFFWAYKTPAELEYQRKLLGLM